MTLSHMHDGSGIPILSVISPRYITSFLGGSFIALFCVGVLLLTFDQIKREENTRIHEVMNSKPTTDLEIFAGRLIGLSLTVAVPMLIFLFAIMTYGMIADVFSLKFGEPIEFWSAVSFVFLDIAPNFVFFGSLVILLSLLLRSRLLALLLTLGGLFGLFWLNSRLSLNVSRPLQTVTGNVLFPSELVPTLLTPMIVFNRIALLLMGAGFLYWSSCLVSRITASRSKELGVGSLSFVFGLLVIGTMFGIQSLEHNRINQWVAVHDAHFDPSAFPDVHQIAGDVDIKPGRSLYLEFTLDVSVDKNGDSDFILFSLNPGYTISHLAVSGIQISDHEFKHGLLKIPRRYFESDLSKLELTATGRPDSRFAYLDTVDTLSRIVGPNVRQVRQLGTENAIFRSNFVVLSPGIKWYPTSGTSTNENAWELRKKDFFTLNIDVSVPRRWLVAGPAIRETLDDDKRAKYRFQQSNPIPEFALVGSRFKSATIKAEGISFELLYAPVHRKQFEQFAHLGEYIRERIKWRLDTIRRQGFDYPYGSFSLIEVPSTLRVFGGGLEMASVMSPPAMVMLRESTMPTTTIQKNFEGNRQEVIEEYNFTEEDYDGMIVDSIGAYLGHPSFESSLSLGLSRSLHMHQSSATGEGAYALNTLMDLLVKSLSVYFDASFDFQLASDATIFNFSSIDPIAIVRSFFSDERGGNVPFDVIRKLHSMHNASDVWDTVPTVTLFTQVDGMNSFLKMRALTLRTERFEQLLRDSLGSSNVPPLLLDLNNRIRGKTFKFEEFKAVVAEHGVDLTSLASELMRTGDLPGFLATNPSMRQLENLEQPKYETTFTLQNNEHVPGPVKLSLTYQNGDDFLIRYMSQTRPSLLTTLVGAKQSLQVVVESANPVQQILVAPYLSLNRVNLRLDLPESDHFRAQALVSDDKPFIKSITEIDHLPEDLNTSITIDDLDPGFSIVELGRTSVSTNVFSKFFRRLVGTEEVPMDQGLPQYSLFDYPSQTGWHRRTDPSAYGRYRHTFAIVDRGDGRALAKFHAKLPSAGKWLLEYHLPKTRFYEEIDALGSGGSKTVGVRVGTFYLEVRNGSTTTSKTLDAPSLTPGWQSIGTIDLAEEEVDVLVSNKTDGLYLNVFADAIRWTPVETDE
ncbi:MAG: ABC transporter permease subunit [Gammaproteobacteria bacterium]|nr:ABC transporter permease subunit [Gammaproteobacteria bacterium]